MTNLNRITILGNTGKDQPKHSATANGKQVTRLTVATNKRYKDAASGEWTTEAIWHKLVVWGDGAAYASRIQPGSLVFLEGEMSYRDYEREIETPEGPVKVMWPVAEIVVSTISVIHSNKAEQKGEAA
jgi:single stranded DNA-binding protein